MANQIGTELLKYARQFTEALRDRIVVSALVNRDYQAELADTGRTVTIKRPRRVAATLKAVGDDTNYSSGAAEFDDTTITLSHDAYRDDTFRSLEEAFAPGVRGQYVKVMAEDVADKIENELIKMMGSRFTNSTGAAGTAVSASGVADLRRKLDLQQAPESPRYAVFHPDAIKTLSTLYDIVTADKIADGGVALREGTIGRRYGLWILGSNKITKSGTTLTNIAFHRDAVTFVTRGVPAPDPATGASGATFTVDGITGSVVMQYDMNKGGPRIRAQCVYGFELLYDALGVKYTALGE